MAMAFSETLKKEVKERAAFKCCRCQKVGIEVHHSIPQESGGLDDIGNAAPLCPNCHDDFGANPEKRKAIFQMRDWWYGQVKVIFGSPLLPPESLRELNENLVHWKKGLSDLNEMKQLLKKMANTAIDTVTPSTATEAMTGVANLVLPPPKILGIGRTVIMCPGCKDFVDYGNYCQKCGTKLK
jgi:hypothetical protein